MREVVKELRIFWQFGASFTEATDPDALAVLPSAAQLLCQEAESSDRIGAPILIFDLQLSYRSDFRCAPT